MPGEVTISETCEFLKANGERCHAQKLRGSSLCYFHSPEVIVERAEARRRGGLNRNSLGMGETGSYLIKSPKDVLIVLEDAVNDAMALPNTSEKAKAIGYLSQIILKGMEVTDLEARIKNLEERSYHGK